MLNARYSPQQMSTFGWRIPLLAGCGIIPFLFIIRRSLAETEDFLARKRHPPAREILQSVANNWRLVVLGTMLVTMTTVSFYMITAYTPTFGNKVLHLADSQTLLVTLCVGISNFIWLPLMGALSDRVGRNNCSSSRLPCWPSPPLIPRYCGWSAARHERRLRELQGESCTVLVVSE